LNKLKTVFAVVIILIMSPLISVAEESKVRTQESVHIRLDSLEKTMNAYLYLNEKIRKMYQNPGSFNRNEIEKIIKGFEILSDYSKKETETNPSDDSYRENLNRFIRNSKEIFSDMEMKETPPRTGKVPGTVSDISNALGMKFVYIPPGTFMMGSPENEPGRHSDETLHRVTLTQGFYMQTTEVTQKQWKDIMGDNPHMHQAKK